MDNHQFYSTWNISRTVELRRFSSERNNWRKKIIAIWRDQVFMVQGGEIKIFLDFYALPSHLQNSQELHFLSIDEGDEVFCLDLSEFDKKEALFLLGKGRFINLRNIVSQMARKQAAYAGYAKGIGSWNRKNIYCGSCGSLMNRKDKGHVRKCSSLNCGITCYPSIDPAVIVLIEHRPHDSPPICLLNRRETDSGYQCSPFAGFVEIGESLEDTVRREMMEEVNVEVENINYVASQPWPFPSSLMIGMIAGTKTKDFRVDNEEIKDAYWYTASDIKKQVTNGTMVLSKIDSIARFLIENWVNKN